MSTDSRIKIGGSLRMKRTVAAFGLSILLGAGFGALSCLTMGLGQFALAGAVVGAAVGMFFSPALAFALRFGPWWSGVAWIGGLTVAATVLGGLLQVYSHVPFVGFVASVSAYVMTSAVRGIIGMRDYRVAPPGLCPQCGYDLAGLAPGTLCPECGGADGGKKQAAKEMPGHSPLPTAE